MSDAWGSLGRKIGGIWKAFGGEFHLGVIQRFSNGVRYVFVPSWQCDGAHFRTKLLDTRKLLVVRVYDNK